MSFDIKCPGKACVLNNVNHIVLGDHYWAFANRLHTDASWLLIGSQAGTGRELLPFQAADLNCELAVMRTWAGSVENRNLRMSRIRNA
ncbi:hypothetical protein DY000_02061709 [Brassica cretica]|uniref:Uncharacterized protein n=1 Tax=Brassica cretica TaxID=69181 RepID=A0ABQ7AXK2_BRACR|nr:hypothetical protein DY000_02061709 [Brassica cretica]